MFDLSALSFLPSCTCHSVKYKYRYMMGTSLKL